MENHTLSGLSTTQPQIRRRDNDEAMVGQQINCMIEGKFEDGFFISVKVKDSDSVLRGLLFKPGRYVPVSDDNDVAPHLPMIRRNIGVVHPQDSAKRAGKYTVEERRDNGGKSLVPAPIQPAQPAHLTIPMNRVVPAIRSRSHVLLPAKRAHPDSSDRSLITVPIQYAENDHHGLANGGQKYTIPERHDSGDRSLVSVPIQYVHHALPNQNDHHGSSNRGRYTVHERRDSGGRSLVHVPIQHAHLTNPSQHTLAPVSTQRAHVHVHAPLAQPTLVPVLAPPTKHAWISVPAPPAQRARVPVPAPPAQRAQVPISAPPVQHARIPVPAPHAHPTIPAHHVVPVILQPFHPQNAVDGVPIHPTHQAIVRNPVVSVKRPAPHLRVRLPVNSDPMQTQTPLSQGQ